MARGRPAAPKPIDVRISEVDEKIATLTSKLTELTSQRETLISEKREQDLQKLMEYIKDSGKSIEEILQAISA